MFICDAQVHIWAGDSPGAADPNDPSPHRAGPFGAEELLVEMAIAGVGRAVLIPPSAQGDSNDVALRAAQRYPDRFAVVGRLRLDAPESRAALAGWKQQLGMLGVRASFSGSARRLSFMDGAAEWLWEAAERERIPVMILVPGLVPAVDAIARRRPDLRIIIDHMGRQSELRDAAAFADLADLLALGSRPNVAVKVSAVPRFSSHVYPYRNLHPYIRRIYEAFGPERMLWGTDLSRLRSSYRQAVTMFTEEMPFLSTGDLEWIMGRSAYSWLDWPLGSEDRRETLA